MIPTAVTNNHNLEDVILPFEQQMTRMRENLRGSGLREMFESAHCFGNCSQPKENKNDSEDS